MLLIQTGRGGSLFFSQSVCLAFCIVLFAIILLFENKYYNNTGLVCNGVSDKGSDCDASNGSVKIDKM